MSGFAISPSESKNKGRFQESPFCINVQLHRDKSTAEEAEVKIKIKSAHYVYRSNDKLFYHPKDVALDIRLTVEIEIQKEIDAQL